jgi:hypothetical protein
MTAIILLGCYLPVAMVPALLPFRLILPFRKIYVWLGVVPAVLSIIAIALANPLIRWMGYSVVFVPIVLSLLSLAGGIIGARLLRYEIGEGVPLRGTLFATLLASAPFLLTFPFIGAEIILIFRQLLGF